MRIHPRIAVVVALFFVCAAPAARASYGSKPDMPTPSSTSGEAPRANGGAQSPREQAEAWYRDAYKDVEKGSSEAAAGKADNAKKRFQRALERSRRATELDSTYHQAWNLLGFTSRKLGDYPGSFAAYRVALRLKPDYALAREYYGEGLLETGDLAGAKQQLAALERIGDAAMIRELSAAIAAYEAAHPAAAADTARSNGGR